MPITPGNPFKGRHYSGEVILLVVRWYLRYPLAYEHVAEMPAEWASRWMPAAFGGGSKRMHRNSISAAGHIFGPPANPTG
jgi:hypothetical protein